MITETNVERKVYTVFRDLVKELLNHHRLGKDPELKRIIENAIYEMSGALRDE